MTEYRSEGLEDPTMAVEDSAASGDFASSYRELRVYRAAFEKAMALFKISAEFPPEERYSLADQIRRSSRSVCTNLAEGWRKRRYKNAFVAKLSDAESEACETQVWLQFANACGYLDSETFSELDASYDHITSQIVLMIEKADRWLIR